MFVAMGYTIRFYSPELEHVRDVNVTDLVDGLWKCKKFKSLPHSRSGTYIMLASINDMEKIEAHDI